MSNYLHDCLSRELIFFTGKGGVGKSTLAWATALVCRRRRKKVAVISWSPFDTASKPFVHEDLGIDFVSLDTLSCFREYALKTLRFERIYEAVFENHVLKTFIKAAPGLSETVIAGKIWDLIQKKIYELIVVDLPSTGHAVSFFQSPDGIRRIFPVGFVHKEATEVCSMFSSKQTRIDLVATPEELPLVEGRELKEKLQGLYPFNFGFLHLNQTLPDLTVPKISLESLPELVRDPIQQFVERKKIEDSYLPLIEAIQMPTKQLPRFAVDTALETVEKVADVLESS